MKKRSMLLALVAAGVGQWLGASAASAAEKFPDRPIMFTVPFPPGGPTDAMARILATAMSQELGQSVIVENKAGAGGNIGAEYVARAKPDGYTIMFGTSGPLAINHSLYKGLKYDPRTSFEPIVYVGYLPNILVVRPDLGANNVQELITKEKAKPGTLSYASPGVGSGLHLAGELFKERTGIDMLHVAYKGTPPALNDVMGGVVPLMFTNLPAALPFIQDGKLLALATTQAQRIPAAPGIPTLAEQGVKGVDVSSWYGLLAPAGTPAEVAGQLARDAAAILAEPEVKQRLTAQGMSQATMSPAAFSQAIRDETAVWAGVLKSRHIQAQ